MDELHRWEGEGGRGGESCQRSVYIAGPMRGYPQFNFPAFDEAAKRGRLLGYDVISPADLDRGSGFNEMDGVPITSAMIREFVARDTGALLSLRAEHGDAIALLPGWDRSTGAKAELAVALWLGLRILDATTFQPFADSRGACLFPFVSN